MNGNNGLSVTTILPVDILGVNETGSSPDTRMFSFKVQSWLRDTATANVQTSWGAAYRDVVILDPLNNKIESYNLATYPLTTEANRTALKNKLIAAATPADTDQDGLPDYWEQWAWGTLSRNGTSTASGNVKTLQYWAHCSTAPATGIIPGLPEIAFTPSDGTFTVIYTRRRGTAFDLTVTPEFAQSLTSWTTAGHGYAESSVKPRYDGSGGETVTLTSVVPAPFPFVRVKAALP